MIDKPAVRILVITIHRIKGGNGTPLLGVSETHDIDIVLESIETR
jgi:hypothetical protein